MDAHSTIERTEGWKVLPRRTDGSVAGTLRARRILVVALVRNRGNRERIPTVAVPGLAPSSVSRR